MVLSFEPKPKPLLNLIVRMVAMSHPVGSQPFMKGRMVGGNVQSLAMFQKQSSMAHPNNCLQGNVINNLRKLRSLRIHYLIKNMSKILMSGSEFSIVLFINGFVPFSD